MEDPQVVESSSGSPAISVVVTTIPTSTSQTTGVDPSSSETAQHRFSKIKLVEVGGLERQNYCCGHWFPSSKSYHLHLAEKAVTDTSHEAKLLDLGMVRCAQCSVWVHTENIIAHLAKGHSINKEAKTQKMVPMGAITELPGLARDSMMSGTNIVIKVTGKNTPKSFSNKISKPTGNPLSKSGTVKLVTTSNSTLYQNMQNMKHSDSNGTDKVIVRKSVTNNMSMVNVNPHLVMKSLGQAGVARGHKVVQQVAQPGLSSVTGVNGVSFSTTFKVAKESHSPAQAASRNSPLKAVVPQSNFNNIAGRSLKLVKRVASQASKNKSLNCLTSDSQNNLDLPHSTKTKDRKVLSGGIAVPGKTHLGKKSRKQILKPSTSDISYTESAANSLPPPPPSSPLPLTEGRAKKRGRKPKLLAADEGGDCNPPPNHKGQRRKSKETFEYDLRNPRVAKRPTQALRGGLNKKKRGPGRPKKNQQSETPNTSEPDSLLDEMDPEDLENEPVVAAKKEEEDIPTVELDLFTLPSTNEQVSVLLTEPQNPNFKVYASMDAIFVGDSALGDVTNQIGYVTDANNVVYVNPSHFLFPNVEDLENFVPSPILTMKGNKMGLAPARKVWNLNSNKAYSPIILKQVGVNASKEAVSSNAGLEKNQEGKESPVPIIGAKSRVEENVLKDTQSGNIVLARQSKVDPNKKPKPAEANNCHEAEPSETAVAPHSTMEVMSPYVQGSNKSLKKKKKKWRSFEQKTENESLIQDCVVKLEKLEKLTTMSCADLVSNGEIVKAKGIASEVVNTLLTDQTTEESHPQEFPVDSSLSKSSDAEAVDVCLTDENLKPAVEGKSIKDKEESSTECKGIEENSMVDESTEEKSMKDESKEEKSMKDESKEEKCEEESSPEEKCIEEESIDEKDVLEKDVEVNAEKKPVEEEKDAERKNTEENMDEQNTEGKMDEDNVQERNIGDSTEEKSVETEDALEEKYTEKIPEEEDTKDEQVEEKYTIDRSMEEGNIKEEAREENTSGEEPMLDVVETASPETAVSEFSKLSASATDVNRVASRTAGGGLPRRMRRRRLRTKSANIVSSITDSLHDLAGGVCSDQGTGRVRHVSESSVLPEKARISEQETVPVNNQSEKSESGHSPKRKLEKVRTKVDEETPVDISVTEQCADPLMPQSDVDLSSSLSQEKTASDSNENKLSTLSPRRERKRIKKCKTRHENKDKEKTAEVESLSLEVLKLLDQSSSVCSEHSSTESDREEKPDKLRAVRERRPSFKLLESLSATSHSPKRSPQIKQEEPLHNLSGRIIDSQGSRQPSENTPVSPTVPDSSPSREWLGRGAKLKAQVLIQDQQAGVMDSHIFPPSDSPQQASGKNSSTESSSPRLSLSSPTRASSLVPASKSPPTPKTPKLPVPVQNREWQARGAKLKAQVMISDPESSLVPYTSAEEFHKPITSPPTKKIKLDLSPANSKDIRSFFKSAKSPVLETNTSVSSPGSPGSPQSTHAIKMTKRHTRSGGDIRKYFSFTSTTPSKKVKEEDVRDVRSTPKTSVSASSENTVTDCKVEDRQSFLEPFPLSEYTFEGFERLTRQSGLRCKTLLRVVSLLNTKKWHRLDKFTFPVDQLCEWDDELLSAYDFD